MKKRDEGYVLAFVLVVIVVICLVAVSMMTVSLRNLEAQTASVERMQDKYQALGLMEETIASVSWNTLLLKNGEGGATLSKQDAIVAFLRENFSTEVQDGDVFVAEADADARLTAEVDLLVQPADGSHKVNVSILWTGKIADNGSEYVVSESEVTYTSYEVVSAETEVGE